MGLEMELERRWRDNIEMERRYAVRNGDGDKAG